MFMFWIIVYSIGVGAQFMHAYMTMPDLGASPAEELVGNLFASLFIAIFWPVMAVMYLAIVIRIAAKI